MLDLLLFSIWRDPKCFVEAPASRSIHDVLLDRVVIRGGNRGVVVVETDRFMKMNGTGVVVVEEVHRTVVAAVDRDIPELESDSLDPVA